MKLRNTVIVIAALAMAAMIQTAQASIDLGTTASLAVLKNTPGGAYLTIGDKTFSNFGWQASLADASELNADAAGLNVSASIVNGIYYLDFSGGLVVNNLAGAGSLLGDLKLNYTVTV